MCTIQKFVFTLIYAIVSEVRSVSRVYSFVSNHSTFFFSTQTLSYIHTHTHTHSFSFTVCQRQRETPTFVLHTYPTAARSKVFRNLCQNSACIILNTHTHTHTWYWLYHERQKLIWLQVFVWISAWLYKALRSLDFQCCCSWSTVPKRWLLFSL